MSSLRVLLRNIAIVSGGQAVTWVATFLFVLAQARTLGPARFGELSLALSYSAFFMIIIDFGVGTHVTRAVAQKDGRATDVLWPALAVRAGLWLVALPTAWALTTLLGYEEELQATILILVDSLLFVGIAGTLGAYLQGNERFLMPTIANAVQRVAASILGIALLNAGFGVVAIAYVYALSAFLAVVLLVVALRRAGVLRPRFDPRAVASLFRTVIPIGLYWIVGTFYFNVDLALVERLTPRESLGHYAAAYRLFSAASIVPALLCGTVLYPMYARLSDVSVKALRPAVEKTLLYLLLAGLLALVLLASLAPQVIGVLYPLPQYAPAASALRLLAPGLLFLYVNSVLGAALFALHLERRLLVIATTAAILNLVTNLLTIPVFGIEAAAVITSLTELFLLVALLVASPSGLVGMTGSRVVRALAAAALAAIALVPVAQAPIAISAALGVIAFAAGCLIFQVLPRDDVRLAGRLVPTRRGREASASEAPRAPRALVVRQMYYDNDPLLRREVDALVDDGFEVEILCMRRDGETSHEQVGRIAVRRLPLSHVRGGIGRYLYEYAAFLALAGTYVTFMHLRRPYDVVQVNTPPDTLVFCAIVPRLTGTPVILHLAETMPEFFATKFKTSLDTRAVRLVGWFERLSIGFASTVITCTEQMREAFASRGSDPSRISVILNSADERVFDTERVAAQARVDDDFVLICHGTMEERYGLDTLVAATSILRDELPDLRVELIGGGTYRPILERMVAERGLEGRVTFSQGWVAMDDLVRAIQRADVGIVAMKRDPFRDITHCNKMFDFITMRKPVIASRTRAVEEYFGDECFELFESSNAADLARAIRRLHDDPARRASLVERATRRNELYRWPRQRAHYLRIVRSAIRSDVARGEGVLERAE